MPELVRVDPIAAAQGDAGDDAGGQKVFTDPTHRHLDRIGDVLLRQKRSHSGGFRSGNWSADLIHHATTLRHPQKPVKLNSAVSCFFVLSDV